MKDARPSDVPEVIQQHRSDMTGGVARDGHDYLGLLGLLPIAVYTCEARSGRITFYNEHAAKLWGRVPRLGESDERFCGSFRLWRPDGTPLPHHETPMAMALRGAGPFRNLDVVVERPDGSRISVLVNIDPILDTDGRVIGAINAFHDTTELRATQEQLRRSEQDLAEFFENATVPLHWVGPDGTILRVNQAELDLLGYPRDEYLGRNIAEFHVDSDVIADILRRLSAGEKLRDYEARLRCKDGSIKDVLIDSSVLWEDGKFIHTRCFTRDVTERKRAQHGLRESETRFRLAQSVARIGVFDWNIQTGVNTWTPELEAIYGLRSGEFAGTRSAFERLVYAEDLPGVVAKVQQAIECGQAVEHEWRIVWPDSTVRWVAGRFQCFKDGRKTPLRLSGVNIDITERKRAEEVRQRLAAIVESSDDAIIGQDLAGTITSWNQAAERLYGYTAEEIIGKPVSRLIPSDHSDDFPAMLERLRRGERIEHYETVRVANDGRRIDVSLTVSPIRNTDGSIIGASKIARDIGERKRAEAVVRQRGERMRLLWEAAGVLLTTIEPETLLRSLFGKIAASLSLDVYFNYMVTERGNALRLLSSAGIPDDVARSMSHIEFGQAVCGVVAQRRDPIVATFIQQSADPMVQLVKSLGIRAYTCNPLLAGGRLIGTLSFASRTRDQFDQDEIEFLQTISQYVAAVYERLAFIDRLRDQDRLKDQFLATLAHELRNPLAPIRTGVQLIQRAGANPALLEKACPMIERQLQHMVRLVDDLLDVSRISRDKLELRREWVDLGTIIQNAIETSRPLIEGAGHEMTVSLPPEPVLLDADPVRLAQAFSNLLNNAAKYTERGGRIWVTAERPEAGDAAADEVMVRIRDTGIGIPADTLPYIFDMFVQADNSLERAHGGLGIGLTLAQRLIEMHGGTLTASSEGAGKGSEFVARLPVVTMPQPQVGDRSHRLQPQKARVSRRILIADDNRDSVEMLATTLQVLGHHVVTAYDGVEAIDRVAADRPDIAFLDLGMPVLSGYDAARRIREQPWGRRVMLVAVTGWGQDDDRRRSHEAGFDAHLVKPVDFGVIEHLVDNPFGRVMVDRDLSGGDGTSDSRR